MQKYAKRAYRKRPAKARRTRKSSRGPRVSKSVKSYVKNTIHRMAENKTISTTLNLPANYYNAPSSGWVTNNVFPLAFNDTVLICSQNNSQSGRVANRVRVVKSMTKFALTFLPYNATTNTTPQPVDIRVFIFSLKKTPNSNLTGSTNQFGGLFQNGSASSPPSTYVSDMLQDFNKDEFIIYYDKIFKLGNASNTGTGADAGRAYFATNDYKYNILRKINTTKMLSKQYGWNDASTSPTSGKQVFIAFLPAMASGDIGGTTKQSFQIWYQQNISYEDM